MVCYDHSLVTSHTITQAQNIMRVYASKCRCYLYPSTTAVMTRTTNSSAQIQEKNTA